MQPCGFGITGALQLAAQGLDLAVLLAQPALDFLAPGFSGRNRLLQSPNRRLRHMAAARGGWCLGSRRGGPGVAWRLGCDTRRDRGQEQATQERCQASLHHR